MNKLVTSGKRILKNDHWHDDNGPLPGNPGEWDPPMTEEEIIEAALSDPDAQLMSEEELARPVPNPPVKQLRRKLGLTQHEFADRFQIPVGSLRDWEQERVAPDRTARAYLAVIAASPGLVEQALKRVREAAE